MSTSPLPPIWRPDRRRVPEFVSLPGWVSGGDIMEYERPTFYAWLMPSQSARAEVGQLSFRGSN